MVIDAVHTSCGRVALHVAPDSYGRKTLHTQTDRHSSNAADRPHLTFTAAHSMCMMPSADT